MRPAARPGDLSGPGHIPVTLTLIGPGCTDVEIQGKKAWRCGDMHGAPGPGCITAPPPAPPHGLEACRMGSMTVLINGQMAVRMGDMLLGAGPPNVVASGAPKVLIGD